MTDRVNMLHVALEKDIRVDDIEPLVNAIRQLRGVLNVSTEETDFTYFVAESRIRTQLMTDITDIIMNKKKK